MALLLPLERELSERFSAVSRGVGCTQPGKPSSRMRGGKRREDSSTSRACAHEALLTRGHRAAPIKGDRGEPIWPDHVVGSLTHCRGYYGAVVAWSGDFRSIGIDAEPNTQFSAESHVAIDRSDELEMAFTEAGSGIHAGEILFSAKEAVYKAWFPVARTRVGLLDVFAQLSADGKFVVSASVRVGTNGLMNSITGRWNVSGGIVYAAAVIPDDRSMVTMGFAPALET